MSQKAKKLFGTDGIRGLANQGPLAAAQVLALGEATAFLLSQQLQRPGRVGLGWDTRQSSPALASALAAGLASGGAETRMFGVIPTPAVSQLTRHFRLDAGIVISASHNPAADNGIKYFSADGGKFPDASERRLEAMLARVGRVPVRTGTNLGPVLGSQAEAAAVYLQLVTKFFKHRRLAGITVAADLAHGATCRTAPAIFEALGIKAKLAFDRPDGCNINLHCGSLHPEAIAAHVKRQGADAGLAFDGDGDRVIFTDENGQVLNGDRLLGILAVHYAAQGRLPGRGVAATVMSNLGLELYLKSRGIRLFRAQVGDRYVAQAMQKNGWQLGGEQSGHLLLPKYSPTGDGVITALEILAVMRARRQPLSVLAGTWRDFPQLLINVPVARRPDLLQLPKVKKEVQAAGQALGERGRVNLRYSGTEPLARVMVEAETPDTVETWAARVADAVEASIGNGQRRIVTWLTCA